WCQDNLFPADDQTFPSLTGVWSAGPGDTWVSGRRLTAPNAPTTAGFVFHWDGCRWSQSTLPESEPGLNGIWGSAPDNVWTVGDHGTALVWDGAYWSSAPVGADVSLGDVTGTGLDDVWASGGYHWNGSTWSRPAGGTMFGDVWAVAPDDVWSTQ